MPSSRLFAVTRCSRSTTVSARCRAHSLSAAVLNRLVATGGSGPWEDAARTGRKTAAHDAPKVRDRALRVVLDGTGQTGSHWTPIRSIMLMLGCLTSTLGRWVCSPWLAVSAKPLLAMAGPRQVIHAEFQSVMAASPVPEPLCDMAIRTVCGVVAIRSQRASFRRFRSVAGLRDADQAAPSRRRRQHLHNRATVDKRQPAA